MKECEKKKNKVIIGTWPISGDFGNVDLITAQNMLAYSYDLGFRQFDKFNDLNNEIPKRSI